MSSDITTHTLDLEGSLISESVEEYSDYNPAFEWPGEDESDSSFKSGPSYPVPIKGQPVLRLVVLQSSILPRKRKVAVLDSYHETQLGRDVQATSSATPRIRLKEMEVSKLHATVYWDGSRKEWNAVDMGSKHGTFLQSGTDSQAVKSRLSPPKFSSIPRRLRHGDRLSIGSTTFAVHIHENQRPCQDCTVSRALEIPLFPAALQRSLNAEPESESAGLEMPGDKRDPKKRMTMLKRSLLKLHDEPKDFTTNADKANYYVDRAARRRMLHISSYSESPGVPSSSAITVRRDTNSRSGCPTPEPSSQPATPINSTNIGHRLLVQQGWTPGTALGNPLESRDGLIEPLEVRLKQNRAGLGSKH